MSKEKSITWDGRTIEIEVNNKNVTWNDKMNVWEYKDETISATFAFHANIWMETSQN